MTNKIRLVFDTNVLISALLLQKSKPGQAFQYALSNGNILLSLETIKELSEVLSRRKFDRYITQEEREEFLAALLERAVLIKPSVEVSMCRDPKDNKFLELALSGGADAIVSGDDDLLDLNPFHGIRILKPEEFLQMLLRGVDWHKE